MVADNRSVSRRSEKSRVAIVAATNEILMERGFEGLTIEAVAARAGVGKGTIYRWWPSRPALVADVLLGDASRLPLPVPLPDTGSLVDDVAGWAGGLTAILTSDRGSALLRILTAASIEHGETAARLRTDLTHPLRHAVEARFLADPSFDATTAQLASDAIIGGIIFRILDRDSEYTPSRAESMARLVAASISARLRQPG